MTTQVAPWRGRSGGSLVKDLVCGSRRHQEETRLQVRLPLNIYHMILWFWSYLKMWIGDSHGLAVLCLFFVLWFIFQDCNGLKVSIGSGNGLSCTWCQAITQSNCHDVYHVMFQNTVMFLVNCTLHKCVSYKNWNLQRTVISPALRQPPFVFFDLLSLLLIFSHLPTELPSQNWPCWELIVVLTAAWSVLCSAAVTVSLHCPQAGWTGCGRNKLTGWISK